MPKAEGVLDKDVIFAFAISLSGPLVMHILQKASLLCVAGVFRLEILKLFGDGTEYT